MQRVIGFGLFIVGIVILIFGINATHKAGEKILGGVTGHYSDTTMWYIIGGILLIIIGSGIVWRGRR